ncbi:MAG TPA: hypothetical protein PLY68_10320 [Myxococcota bacterium]|nr:hypothetical protein [Myxococcota bacterium]
MKRLLPATGVATVLSLVLAGLAACSPSPSKVLSEMQEAAARGDATRFASYFTSAERPFAEALVSIQKDVRGDEPGKPPIQGIYRSVVVDEKIEGDTAFVTASSPDGQFILVFVREDGAWRLDAAATEQHRGDNGGGVR